MWGETIHTLMQYRGVVHCVGGDNTHGGGGGDNTHTNAV